MPSALYSGDVGIYVEGVGEETARELRDGDVAPAHIADYACAACGDSAWTVMCIEGTPPAICISLTTRQAQIMSRRVGVWDIVKVCNLLSERSRQERSSYGIHAAAFEMNGRGVLLVGDSMAGKSALLIQALGWHGCNLIGSECVVIGSALNLVGGTRTIALAQEAFAYYHPLLGAMVRRVHASGRVILDAGSMDVRNVTNVPLKLIVLPKVTRVGAHERHELNHRLRKHLLFRQLGEYIHGLDAIHDQMVPLPSLDDEELKLHRLRAASAIADRIRVLMLVGTPSEILRQVVRELGHS